MKVLFLTNLPAPYTVEFLNELGKLCELTVLFERHTASDRDEKWISKAERTYREIYLKGVEIGTENSFCPSVKKYLKEDFDHIVIGMYSTYTAMYAIKYLKSKKRAYIVSTDGGFVADGESTFKFNLKRKLIGGAAAWLSTCKSSDEYLKYYGADEEKIYRYPFTSIGRSDILMALPSEESKLLLRQKHDITASKVVIGVGQLIPRKGWDLLVDAVRKIENTDVHFVIVGGERDRFVSLMAENGEQDIPDNISIMPFMTKEDLFELYRLSDLFVLPTREDVWGLVVNEAMANGLPVISTVKCNAGLELIEENINGKIIPVGDSKSLCNALSELLAEPEKMYEIGANNLKKISAYTYEVMGKKVYEALNKINYEKNI